MAPHYELPLPYKAANFDALVPSLIGPARLLWIKADFRQASPVFRCGAALKRVPTLVTGHPPAPDRTHSSQRPA